MRLRGRYSENVFTTEPPYQESCYCVFQLTVSLIDTTLTDDYNHDDAVTFYERISNFDCAISCVFLPSAPHDITVMLISSVTLLV